MRKATRRAFQIIRLCHCRVSGTSFCATAQTSLRQRIIAQAHHLHADGVHPLKREREYHPL